MHLLSEKKTSMNPDLTVLMDETAVYFEAAREQTVGVQGSHYVVVRATGFSSMRISVILVVSAGSRKLLPVLIWGGGGEPTYF
jgi:hypothetical protein